MTKQELKAKIDKLENGIKSKATPSNLIAPLKAQKAKLEKELEDMEAAEKKAVKTKKVSKVSEKIKAAKKSVAKKTPAKAPAKEERKKDNIVRDGDRKSLPAGKRISKNGKVYYENRVNRSDKQTSRKPYLAKGGNLKFYDKENSYRLARPSGYIEKDILRKVTFNEDDFVGNFGWKTSEGKLADGYLFKLNEYDKNLVKDIKLKEGEKIYRYFNRTSAIGGMKPLIKISTDKELLYFLAESENDEIVFETKGVQAQWIALIQDKMADGGETEQGVDLFEDYENIPTNVQEVLDKYSDAFEDGDYRKLEKANNELKKIGYTFEYGLDGEAYDLRKIGQRGKMDEDEYAKGGELQTAQLLIIDPSNPLSSQVKKITGDYLNSDEYKDISVGNFNILTHKASKKVFIVYPKRIYDSLPEQEKQDDINYLKNVEKIKLDTGSMADGGMVEIGSEGMYRGGAAKVLKYDDKTKMYTIKYLNEDGEPEGNFVFARKDEFEYGFSNFNPKMADGGYVIFEGRDNYNNKPLYKVISKDEDNDYDGEFHDNREDAEKELNELKNKDMNYGYGGKTKSRKSMKDLTIEQMSSMTGVGKAGIERFSDENNLSEEDLSNIMQGLGRRMISASDFATAVSGNKDNQYTKEIVDFAKSGKGYKMADGGEMYARQSIKGFYVDTYPTDELGQEINDEASFEGLNKVLDCNIDVYEYLGVGDSLVRERVFAKLAQLMGVSYNVIYDKWLGSDYAKGGYMADGGMMDVVNTEVSTIRRNIMGTTSMVMKIKGMKKPQDFIVYPISADQAGKPITIQSDTRFGFLDLSSGRGLMSQSHPNGAYSYHFTADKKVPFKLSETDLQRIKEHISGTAGSSVGNMGISSDNSGASMMASGGEVPAHFGSGKNIDVFGYQTENFDICGTAVKEFESAMEIMQNGKESEKESLARCAKYVDGLFGTEKLVVETAGADDANFYDAVSDIMSASIYNYRAEMSINLFSFVPQHLKEIAIRMEKAEKGGLYALGGMTAGRWYRDKSGEEFKFIGKIDSGENKGKFLFTDGQKSVYKDLEDFEGGRPKETKLFGFFEDGGSVAEGNYEMLMSNIKAIKHHAEELEGAITPNTEIEAWVLSKSERAETDLSDITHYLDGLKMADGGYMADGGINTIEYNQEVDYIVSVARDNDISTNNISLKEFEKELYEKQNMVFTPEYVKAAYQKMKYKGYEKGGYMAKGGDLSSIKKKYEENEDENAHSENVVLLAKHFGTKEDLAKAKEILALHEKEGSLSSENGKKRQELHLKLIDKARAEMGKQGIEFEKGGYMASGGEVRYKLAGSNFGQQIENGKKFAELIKKAHENQTSEHKYPENFIKEIAYTGKIVKNDGTYFLKDYSYKGVLDRFEFLGDKYFLESLKYLNRPTIKNFKFEDGGMMAKGGEIAFDNSNLYLNGFGMDSNGNSVVKVSFPNQRAFSIQTNGVLKETNNLYTKNIKELTEAQIKTIEKEVVDYVKQFGSKEQKQRLKTYSGYMAKGGEFKPYGKTKGKYKIEYTEDGEKQSEVWESKEMVEDRGKRLLKLGHTNIKITELKQMAKGGIYSSDSLYILKVSKDGKEVGEERFRAKNIREAKEIGEDYEEKYKTKFGGDLSFSVKEAMASGGKVKFADKVKSVQESLLKRKKVSPKVQKDYGKTYSKAEAKESAQRIVGSRMAQLKEKMAKKKK